MAEIGDGATTLVDIAKMMDPDGSVSAVAELLSEQNDIITDIPWVESNLPTGHQTSQRTSLPSTTWRLANAGTAPSKSTAAQAVDSIGILEAWAEIDQHVADLNGNSAKFRLQESMAFIEAMGQEFTQTMFYGNTGSAPEEFMGFAPRFAATTDTNGQNILLGGGAGADNSSIWLVGWAADKVAGIYPKGSMAGLNHENLGLVTVETTAGVGTAGARMRAYQDHYVWKCGLMVKDWRYVVRIPNIDISALVSKTSAADLYDLMIEATHTVPNLSACNPVFYMNRSCFKMLDIQGRDDVISGGGLKFENVEGKRITSFRGIPVRISDQLTEAEAVLS